VRNISVIFLEPTTSIVSSSIIATLELSVERSVLISIVDELTLSVPKSSEACNVESAKIATNEQRNLIYFP